MILATIEPLTTSASSIYLTRAVEFFSFEYEFVTLAMLASVLLGGLCGLIGTFLVLRGMSLLGDAVGHSTLPGICVAFLVVGQVGSPFILLGALVSALCAAVFVGFSSRLPRARQDASIGIVLALFFGIGIVLLSYIQRVAVTSYAGLDAMLLGNVAGMTYDQLAMLGGIAVVLVATVLVGYRWLMLTSFDPVFARVTGVPVKFVHYGLLTLLSVCVVLSIQAVGVVLVSAMLIIPGSSARFWSRRLPGVLMLATLIGAVAGLFGAFLSYMQEGVPTGPAMVLVASLVFAISFLFGPVGGLLAKARLSRARKLENAPQMETL